MNGRRSLGRMKNRNKRKVENQSEKKNVKREMMEEERNGGKTKLM